MTKTGGVCESGVSVTLEMHYYRPYYGRLQLFVQAPLGRYEDTYTLGCRRWSEAGSQSSVWWVLERGARHP